MTIHHFLIIVRQNKRNTQSILKKVLDALEKQGFAWTLEEWVLKKYPSFAAGNHPDADACDAVLSIGGDGTFLASSHIAAEKNLPLLGVNVGRLGFLTGVDLDEADSCFAALREGKFTLKERMLLLAEYGDRPVLALNDAVVNRGGYSKSIDLDVFVGGERLGRYIADGLIIATPMGSTGYSLSAGGPVVSPEVNCLILTPVCAHSLQNRSILVSPEEVITVRMHEKRDYRMVLSCDGRDPVTLGSDDVLRIRVSDQKQKVICIHESPFFARVQAKLN